MMLVSLRHRERRSGVAHRRAGGFLQRRDWNHDAVATDHSTTLVVLDLLGIFVFGISGALVAVRKELDVFGVVVLAVCTGLGGGFMRDVLIGAAPPTSLVDWRYHVDPVVAGLLTFWFHPTLGRMERSMLVMDALGLALFAPAGALKAVDLGLGFLPATVMGLVTGIGGGVLRDVLAGRVPLVFKPGVLYAIPAAAGAAVAVLGLKLGLHHLPVSLAGATVIAVWRLLAIWRKWQAPMPQGPASV
jgi:uncharacterized membrane protein YeiH